MTIWKQEVSSILTPLVPPRPPPSPQACPPSWGHPPGSRWACPSPSPSASVWMTAKNQVKRQFHLFSWSLICKKKACLYTPPYLIRFYFLILSDVSSADVLSVSSQPEEVCARVLVRIADHMEVNAEPPLIVTSNNVNNRFKANTKTWHSSPLLAL